MDNPVPGVSAYETDDVNLAALLRAKDIPQTGRRAEDTADPDRPHYYFQFENTNDQCAKIAEEALLGTITVNFRRFVAEQNAIRDQIFKNSRRAAANSLPPFLARRRPRG